MNDNDNDNDDRNLAERVRDRVSPLVEYLHDEAVGGLVLLGAAIVALVWANSPLSDQYFDLWHTHLDLGLDLSLQHWVNDGLMALFFFVVGLEIKRELVCGELRDPRAALLPEIAENIRRRGGAASLLIAFHPPDRRVEGRSLADVARARGTSPEDAARALLASHDTPTVSFNMSMDDIEFLMRQPWMLTCSDGAIYLPGEGRPHPRGHGAFTRKLTTFARERGTITLGQALHSMTGLSAQVFSLAGRGQLAEGAHADVVVFDPAALRDRATYQEPHLHASGMSYVFVNGVAAVDDGRATGALAGVSLRREARRP